MSGTTCKMALSNREAYEAKRRGKSVPVVCNECGDKVWTAHAQYTAGRDVWECDNCVASLVEETISEMSKEDSSDE